MITYLDRACIGTLAPGISRDLGLTTVAEGIEGAAELEIVRRLGCDYGQGYYFSQPVNAATFESLLGLRPSRPTVGERALPAKS